MSIAFILPLSPPFFPLCVQLCISFVLTECVEKQEAMDGLAESRRFFFGLVWGTPPHTPPSKRPRALLWSSPAFCKQHFLFLFYFSYFQPNLKKQTNKKDKLKDVSMLLVTVLKSLRCVSPPRESQDCRFNDSLLHPDYLYAHA